MFELKLNKHYPKVIGDLTLICNIRGRIISHTPEENIRQAIVSFLVKEKGYPKQNIEIEVPMSRFAEGASGRADIIIYNNQRDILCVIECKRPGEPITDNILEQVKRYDDILQAETICIVLGKLCYFFTYNELNECAVLATEFPTYKELDAKDICYSDNKAEEFKRIPFRKIKQTDIDDLIYDGIIGENTEDKYYPFLINLYNFFMEEDDRMKLDKIKDIGLKAIKYGNAGSGTFYGNYRSFLVNEKSIVSFSISSMTRGDGYPVNTSLMLGVDTLGKYHLSLELRVDKYISLKENQATITHDGTITVGKLGASKRSELIDFVKSKAPHLIVDGKVFLGELDFSNDLLSSQKQISDFIHNCIDYALVRDEFREIKKGIANNSTSLP